MVPDAAALPPHHQAQRRRSSADDGLTQESTQKQSRRRARQSPDSPRYEAFGSLASARGPKTYIGQCSQRAKQAGQKHSCAPSLMPPIPPRLDESPRWPPPTTHPQPPADKPWPPTQTRQEKTRQLLNESENRPAFTARKTDRRSGGRFGNTAMEDSWRHRYQSSS